jgi:hypothetical protein
LPCLSAILGRSLTRESIFPAYATTLITKPQVSGNVIQYGKIQLILRGPNSFFKGSFSIFHIFHRFSTDRELTYENDENYLLFLCIFFSPLGIEFQATAFFC